MMSSSPLAGDAAVAALVWTKFTNTRVAAPCGFQKAPFFTQSIMPARRSLSASSSRGVVWGTEPPTLCNDQATAHTGFRQLRSCQETLGRGGVGRECWPSPEAAAVPLLPSSLFHSKPGKSRGMVLRLRPPVGPSADPASSLHWWRSQLVFLQKWPAAFHVAHLSVTLTFTFKTTPPPVGPLFHLQQQRHPSSYPASNCASFLQLPLRVSAVSPPRCPFSLWRSVLTSF